jgi:hypothetical protein
MVVSGGVLKASPLGMGKPTHVDTKKNGMCHC